VRHLEALWKKIWTEKLFLALVVGYIVLLILLLSGIAIQSFFPDLGSKLIGATEASESLPVTMLYSGQPPAS